MIESICKICVVTAGRTSKLAALVLLLQVGCSSFSSTLLHRSEGNCSWERQKPLHGVPITLKVPTHVRVDVAEKHFLVLNHIQKTTNGEMKTVQAVQRRPAKLPLREISYHMIETEKLFVVDLKRPGAGTMGATVDFNSEQQYFDEIKTRVVDETIAEVGNLLATVAPSGLFGVPTTESTGAKVRGRVKQVSTVVASKIFEIDAPDFEFQVRVFLDQHLNCCHDCGVLSPDLQPPAELPPHTTYPLAPRQMLTPADEQSLEGEVIQPSALLAPWGR